MAYLKIMSGENAGTKFEIDKDEITVGRSKDNTIVLNDAASSSKHCVIRRSGKKYLIADAGSTNGTRVNEQKITETRLKPKDIIKAGAIEIMFDGEDVDVDTASRMTGVFIVEHGGPQTAPPIGGPSPFDHRKDSRTVWITVIAVVSLLALGALGWFIYQLMSAK